ncbi:MAG TPA: hypothetical protein VJQ46_15585 [Gemmatimonadales bacterium]|nr:hypothetical protein [Gemmatimonadales bacterium]
MTDQQKAEAPAHGGDQLLRHMAERIQNLEREGRRLRRLWMSTIIGLAVLLGLAASLVIVSAKHGFPGTVADVIESRQFLVRDKGGTVRGVFGATDGGDLRLSLQSSGSRAGVTLTALKGGASGLTFTDSAGKARGVLGLLPDETTSLTFGDRNGQTRSALSLNPEGSATLVFADRTGSTRAGLGVDSRGVGTFTVVDRPGAARTPEPEADSSDDAGDTGPTAAPAPNPAKK